MTRKPFPMVVVKWLDAHTVEGWMKEREYRDLARKASLMVTYTTGFLLAQDARAITVMQSVSPDNDTMADSITIPRGCILRVRRISAARG